jgi:hypothetical protein
VSTIFQLRCSPLEFHERKFSDLPVEAKSMFDVYNGPQDQMWLSLDEEPEPLREGVTPFVDAFFDLFWVLRSWY